MYTWGIMGGFWDDQSTVTRYQTGRTGGNLIVKGRRV